MPLVSIIVPNYNHAPFLDRRLDSIFNQTCQDFEVWFLDDASTDDSRERFEPYASDARVRSIFNEQNSGSPFAQWNRGLDVASGEFVWIAESDDFAEPEFLARMISALEGNPGAGLATCLSYRTDGADRDHGIYDSFQWFTDAARWRADYFNGGREEVADYLSFQSTIPNASAVLFRRAPIDDGLRVPGDMRMAGDWWFWVSILLRADICHVARPLNHFRQPHEESQRRRTASSGREIFEGFVVGELVENSLELGDRRRLRNQSGLMKRWLSISTSQGIERSARQQIYRRFLAQDFDSSGIQLLHRLMATATLLLSPFVSMPVLRDIALAVPKILSALRSR